jgi:predicted DNA-binding transcriptional regulator AlpA
MAMQLLRYEDLREQRIVRSRTTLHRWIDERSFPPGRILGKFRFWTVAEVMAWIEKQPTTKATPRGFVKQQQRAAKLEAEAKGEGA